MSSAYARPAGNRALDILMQLIRLNSLLSDYICIMDRFLKYLRNGCLLYLFVCSYFVFDILFRFKSVIAVS